MQSALDCEPSVRRRIVEYALQHFRQSLLPERVSKMRVRFEEQHARRTSRAIGTALISNTFPVLSRGHKSLDKL
jgi:hypothetical protein